MKGHGAPDSPDPSAPPASPRSERDVVRSTLGIVFLLLLLGAVFWTLRPVLPAMLWSSAIVIATWPQLVWLERRLGGRRGLAAAVLTLLLTLLLVLPFVFGVVGILNNAEQISAAVQSLSTVTPPPPPAWLERVPVVGEQVASVWRETAAQGGEGILARLAPYANRAVSWLVSQLGSAGIFLFQIILTVIGVVFLYRNGDTLGRRISRFAARIAGHQGETAILLAAQATRSVALGVLGTAIIQALLAGAGLLVVGVPWAGFLTVVMIITGLAQLGPTPVLVPAVIWLYWRGEVGWGTALAIWTGLVTVVDNVIRPFLIRLGADLPLMLIFVGVIGGLVGFGVVGLFIGPALLAVTYRLMLDWVERDEANPPPSGAGALPAGEE